MISINNNKSTNPLASVRENPKKFLNQIMIAFHILDCGWGDKHKHNSYINLKNKDLGNYIKIMQ